VASQGPLFPATAASLSEASTLENKDAWATPTNVFSDNATESNITAATFDSPDISQILVASNFSFTIPAGATIDGITVEIDRRSIITGSGKDFRVQLGTGTAFANLVGTNKASATTWPATTAVATYGGAADTWTAGLTAAQVNAAGFAVFLSASALIANADIGVDFIRVTVNYTETSVTVTPGTASLVLTTFAPAVTVGGPISLRGVGALAASATDTAVVTFPLPAGFAAGDVAYLFVQGSSGGDTDLSDPSGWTRLSSLFLEIGTNDMELYVWRRVLAGGDAEPTITVDTAHSGSALGVFGFVAAWVGVDGTTPEDATTVFSSSAAAATWTPTGITTASANAQAVSIVVTDDDNMLALSADAGFTDRASGADYQSTIGGDTAFGLADMVMQTAGAVTQPTWEETVLGNDAWIGAALALRAAVDAGNITVTPGVASLTTAPFAPTVTASDHKVATPGVASLTLATFVPTVGIGVNVVPAPASLTLSTFAPVVTATAHQTVTPTTAALTLSTFAPNVTTTNHQLVVPGVATLVTATFAPTIALTDHRVVTPSTAALTLTTFVPLVTGGSGLTVVPAAASLTLTTFAPTVSTSAHQTAVPDLASLGLTTFVPTVTATAHQTVTPGLATLVFVTFAPDVDVAGSVTTGVATGSVLSPHTATGSVLSPHTATGSVT
jgi:hypothetical protein